MNRFTSSVANFAALCLTASFAFASDTLEVAPSGSDTGTVGESSMEETWTCGTPDATRVRFSTTAKAEIKIEERFVPIEIPVVIEIVPVNQFKPGDITRDGFVDMDDLLEVINHWGHHAKSKRLAADIVPAGGNQSVDFDDMLIVLQNWGM